MKLKFLAFLVGASMGILNSSAQEKFLFENHLRDTVHLNYNSLDIGSHYLGDDLAIKYYRIQETYTYVEQGNVQNPVAKTVVQKPTIYYSLKKLNSYYKKQLRKGNIDSSKAIQELGRYFDIGFSIYQQDTSEFEEALKSARKPDEIAEVFAQVVLE
jgi:hypothetical protein